MKIGYPCINRSVECQGDKTFRLKSYSPQRLIEVVTNNLDCLEKMLQFNIQHQLLFFRISSALVPFASHPICQFDWQSHFQDRFKQIGKFIRKHDIRISMHPDQFVLINSIDEGIFHRSEKELQYHADVLNALGLDNTAKIQIHVGGVYGDRKASMDKFVERFAILNKNIQNRLVIENDDVRFPAADCLEIHRRTKIPILFDTFHHSVLNHGEDPRAMLQQTAKTWRKQDGRLMVDYSSHEPGGKRGKHTEHIDREDFKQFLRTAKGIDMDIMLEIKDKELSALEAAEIIQNHQT